MIPVADPEVDLFAGMKKKKKKQVVLDVEETSPAPVESPVVEEAPAKPATVEEPSAPAIPAPAPLVDEAAGSGAATPVDGDKAADAADADLFADMKKKKKKKKEIPLDLVSGMLSISEFR